MLEVVDIEYIRKKYYVEGWSIRTVCQHLAGNFPRSRRIDLEPSLTVGWEWLATHSCPFEHR